MLDNGEIIVGFIYEEALEAKESKEHLILMLVKDVMFLRFCVFFLIIIIVFVCGYFVSMGSCFGWYLQEAPSKNDLETREGFHNLFCYSDLCFFYKYLKNSSLLCLVALVAFESEIKKRNQIFEFYVFHYLRGFFGLRAERKMEFLMMNEDYKGP